MKIKVTNVALLPPSKIYENNQIFNEHNKTFQRDNTWDPFLTLQEKLKSSGYDLKTFDLFKYSEIDIVLAYRVDMRLRHILKIIKANPKVKIVYLMTEPFVICPIHTGANLRGFPFDSILTSNDDEVEKYENIKKLNTWATKVIDINEIPNVPFSQKKLITTISANKTATHQSELYSERVNAIKYFMNSGMGIDLYGVGWETSEVSEIKKAYKGKIVEKKEVMKNYKFCICYENCSDIRGYITEKIFDCFASGCVPIYYGATNVSEYIPKECFIEFTGDYDKIYDMICNITEAEHQRYLQAARGYLKTGDYLEFTSPRFAEIILSEIEKVKDAHTVKRYFLVRLKLFIAVFSNIGFYLRNAIRLKRLLFDIFTTR